LVQGCASNLNKWLILAFTFPIGLIPLVFGAGFGFNTVLHWKGLLMTTFITICDTCKREDWDETKNDRTHGEALAELVETQAKGRNVETRRISCLMGCTHGCNIAIQAEGKLAYTLGRFEPNTEDAAAIVDYAELHAQSESGQVPFKQWPQGVKGHFVTRMPPLPGGGKA